MSYTHYAQIILDEGLDKLLDYGVPEEWKEGLKPGMRVEVPLRRRTCTGTVFSLKDSCAFTKVEPILRILGDVPFLSEELFTLAHWISSYYASSLRKTLKYFLPQPVRKEQKEKEQLFVKRLISPKKLLTLCEELTSKAGAQSKVLEILLAAPDGLFLTDLLKKSGGSSSPVYSLQKKKVLSIAPVQVDRSLLEKFSFFPTTPKTLYDEQKVALTSIVNALQKRSFKTFLLHGITGSGKTEIYLQAIAKTRELGRGAILLVPEVSLTTQTIERIKGRFTERIAVLHHRLSAGERLDTWRGIHKGDIHIVIGARSAIFAPVQNLGLIIVDEEHDGSYKQSDEMPCYHARDVAVMRGKLTGSAVILGSATPSLETYTNAKEGKYTLLSMTKRPKEAKSPKVTLIDMIEENKKEKHFTTLSSPLLTEIKKRISLGEQSLLFLNRRGYYTSQRCIECGEIVKCPSCDSSLTYHRGDNVLTCHLCYYTVSPPPKQCPSCKGDTLKYRGIGTEQVERALHAIFPTIRTLRMDGDTTKQKGSHDRLFKQFRAGKADVLIGTQMIAKGLHFPAVTLVGVLNADQALQLPDFRASESVFQLITQVSGRSGRGELPGEVFIQTSLKEHPIISLATQNDYIGFYDYETKSRKLFSYPPFGRLAKCTFSSEKPSLAEQKAKEYHHKLRPLLPPSYSLSPVTPCGRAKIKNRYRFQFLVKGEEMASLSHALKKLQMSIYKPKGLSFTMDIDTLQTFS